MFDEVERVNIKVLDKVYLSFNVKLSITFYYGGSIYFAFMIKPYFALLTYLQYLY